MDTSWTLGSVKVTVILGFAKQSPPWALWDPCVFYTEHCSGSDGPQETSPHQALTRRVFPAQYVALLGLFMKNYIFPSVSLLPLSDPG